MTPEERAEYVEQVKAEVKERKATAKEAAKERNRVGARVRSRLWRQRHPEEARIRKNRWRAQNPKVGRKDWLKRSLGITLGEWDLRFVDQGHRCKLCSAVESGSKQGWHTDHDHVTGRVRGILCCHCNRMLGGARDNPETLQKAIEYLRVNASTPPPVAMSEPGSVSTGKVGIVKPAHGCALTMKNAALPHLEIGRLGSQGRGSHP